jgi:tetratricopeptide (TPR) repeat protein
MQIKKMLTLDNVKRLQTLISQSAISLISVCLIVVIVRQLFHTGVNIQPIQVPTSLSEKGLTSEVTAQWLLDEILFIQSQASTIKAARNVQPEWREINMEVPGSGFTTKTIGDVIRASLGIKQDTISGEVIEYDGQYTIRIRLSQKSASFSEVITEDTDFKSLFHQAAKLTFMEFDPFIYASYLYTEKNYDDAIRIAVDIVKRKGSNRQDIVWSQNLLGIIYAEQNNFEKSETAYKNAIALNARFAIAHFNLSNLYYEYDKFYEALEAYSAAKRLDRNLRDNNREAIILLKIAESIHFTKQNEALQKLNMAAKLNPKEPDVWRLWGDILMSTGNATEAINKFSVLANLLPNYAPAFIKLATAQMLLGDCKPALRNYNKALDLDPDGYSYLHEDEIPKAKDCL